MKSVLVVTQYIDLGMILSEGNANQQILSCKAGPQIIEAGVAKFQIQVNFGKRVKD